MSLVSSVLATSSAQRLAPVSTSRTHTQRGSRVFTQASRVHQFRPALASLQRNRRSVRVQAGAETDKEPIPFGYTRKDAIIIGVGLIGGGVGLKYGLELAGIPDLQAGIYAQMGIFVVVCLGWVSTYVFRVATKNMTYVQQLQQYEEAVMSKRLEEMTEEELKALNDDLENDKRA